MLRRTIAVLLGLCVAYEASAARVIESSKNILVLRSERFTDGLSAELFRKAKAMVQECKGHWQDWSDQYQVGRTCDGKFGWQKNKHDGCETVAAGGDFAGVNISDPASCKYAQFFLSAPQGYKLEATSEDDTDPSYEIEFSDQEAESFAELLARTGATVERKGQAWTVSLSGIGDCRGNWDRSPASVSCRITFR